MLRLSKLTDYATVLMTHMARPPLRQSSSQALAQALGLPPPTVATLLKMLTRAGLVVSTRGVGGGYALARAPKAISVAQIIAAIEGPVALTECARGEGQCAMERTCATRGNWQLISQAVQVALEAVTLADMLRPMRPAPAPAIHFQATPRKAATSDG